MSASSVKYNKYGLIRIYSATKNELVHELPLPVREDKLALAQDGRKNKAKQFKVKDFYVMLVEKLYNYEEGSVFHKDEIGAAFPDRNVNNQMYELFNVLEALGYLGREGAGMFQWFGPKSVRAAKTLKDLKTVAINNQDEDGSFNPAIGDVKMMTTPKLAEIVLMIFLSLGHNTTISKQQIFSLIFKSENEKLCTAAMKLPKVLKVLEAIGIILHDFPIYADFSQYCYVGPDVECDEFLDLEEFEETAVKEKEVNTANIITLGEDELQFLKEETVPLPRKEIVLEENGTWTIRDYVPVSYSYTREQSEIFPQIEEKKSVSESSQVRENRFVGLVEVKDEILDETDKNN